MTPLILPGRPDVHQHVWITWTATHGAHMSISMLRLQTRRHLVLLCVKLHGTASCTSTPSSSVDTHQVKLLTPRPDPLDQATSSFSVHLAWFRSFRQISDPRSIPNIFSTPILMFWIFLINSRLHYNLDGNISRASGFSEKYYRIPKLGFRPISGFPVVLRSRRACFPSCLIPVLLPMSSK